MHEKVAPTNPDALVAGIAARQHGVVALAQIERAGIHRQGLTTRVRAGRLHRVHRGVYAVGHLGLSREGRWMAAVLGCGRGAVLSHGSAAALWGLLPPLELIHVSVPGRAGRLQRDRLRVHRPTALPASETTRRLNIPVTTPSRTLLDLRRVLATERFAAAVRQAEFLRLPVDRGIETDHTRSELERRFLGLCRRHRLPPPEVNVRVGTFVVDFAWPGRRLIVEVDGYRTHGTRSAFEADRERDAQLKLLGYEVIRLTWRGVVEHPADTAATLRTLLTSGD